MLNEQGHLAVLTSMFNTCEKHLKDKNLKLIINIKKCMPQL